jgi:hypothetical protein
MVGIALVVGVTLASPIGAQEPAPTNVPADPEPPEDVEVTTSEIDRDAARTLVQQGDERLAEKDYEGALTAYQRADDIMGVPTTSIEVGRVLMLLGRLVEARTALERAAGYPNKDDEPEPFTKARDEAALLIAEIDRRIPTIAIAVEGPAPDAVELRIDDGVRRGWSEPFRIDPGEHTIVVAAEGYERAERSLSVKEGTARRVTVAMIAESPQPLPPDSDGMDLWPFAIGGLSLAGAGLVVGAVTGGLSLADAADAKKSCNDDGACAPQAEEPLNRSRTLAHVSTTSFVLAGAGAALGATMLVLILTDEEGDSPGAEVVLAPTQLGVRGRF